ncbi:hypothetical protein PR048_033052 [Dryococelus australis]|uniref:Uncharacterized protein n=1 Tax=Dryococelus australis TaxID=614101 RepID=A0ABQ9G0F4_9NEOP|nr:hypothetical protein PR048_033052 [Dryococelus australis]
MLSMSVCETRASLQLTQRGNHLSSCDFTLERGGGWLSPSAVPRPDVCGWLGVTTGRCSHYVVRGYVRYCRAQAGCPTSWRVHTSRAVVDQSAQISYRMLRKIPYWLCYLPATELIGADGYCMLRKIPYWLCYLPATELIGADGYCMLRKIPYWLCYLPATELIGVAGQGALNISEQRRNARAGKTGYSLENPPASGIVRRDYHVRISGSDPAGNRTHIAYLRGEFDCRQVSSGFSHVVMPLVGGYSRGYPASLAHAFRRCSILTSIQPHWFLRPRLTPSLLSQMSGMPWASKWNVSNAVGYKVEYQECLGLQSGMLGMPWASKWNVRNAVGYKVECQECRGLQSGMSGMPWATKWNVRNALGYKVKCQEFRGLQSGMSAMPMCLVWRVNRWLGSGCALCGLLTDGWVQDVPYVAEVSMEHRWNVSEGKTGEPRENPPTNGIVRHDSHLQKSRSDEAGK